MFVAILTIMWRAGSKAGLYEWLLDFESLFTKSGNLGRVQFRDEARCMWNSGLWNPTLPRAAGTGRHGGGEVRKSSRGARLTRPLHRNKAGRGRSGKRLGPGAASEAVWDGSTAAVDGGEQNLRLDAQRWLGAFVTRWMWAWDRQEAWEHSPP